MPTKSELPQYAGLGLPTFFAPVFPFKQKRWNMIITLLLEKKENKRSVPSKSSLESVRLAVLRGELPDDAKTIRQMIEAEHSPSDTIAPDLPGQDQEEVTLNPKI